MQEIKEQKTCNLMNWTTGEVCGAKTDSREARLDHITKEHTPSPAQWSEAYKTVE